jgi:YgiT-type zinc finger domain-containing protein
MTGEHANSKPCPVCGGSLHTGEATIPYILDDDVVIVVKNVPAEICGDCREAFTSGEVTDRITGMLRQLKSLHSEVSVITYSEYEPA